MAYYAILFRLDNEDGSRSDFLDCLLERFGQQTTASLSLRYQCEEIAELFRSNDRSLIRAAEYNFLGLLYKVYHKVITEKLPEFLERNGTERLIPAEIPPPFAKEITGNNPISAMAEIHVKKALAIMEKSVQRSISIGEIARLLAVSPEYLTRIFKSETKMGPHHYFLRLKVEGAAGLLISTNKLISEIALWFGFKNQFHFSCVFKRYTNISPSGYRKMYLQTVDFSQLEIGL